MKNNQESVLNQYTVEELVRILEEECKALNVSCVNNGCETDFVELNLPTNYTIQMEEYRGANPQSYSYLIKKGCDTFSAWNFTELSFTDCAGIALQSAA